MFVGLESNKHMTDTLSVQQRSRVMAAIKNKGSIIEQRVAAILKEYGVRYRKHSDKLPGKPDFYITRLSTVLFVDSCYWHGCLVHGSQPKSNRKFWKVKLERNRARDKEMNNEYRRLGWRVIRIWEHELTSPISKRVIRAIAALSR
ncbi:MAG: DNA mismatch endonuclease, patch repair protein [Parcubacteria group bacterium Athens0416_74]|nr:MAG: DNA mismatch endonuclease, patch repair protein [Parcubacteria group bacterium Athens0416_74]